tara:strand:+ start:493 stop:849 length:357 start_codon:yes stop_codon:yes gene_type:complete
MNWEEFKQLKESEEHSENYSPFGGAHYAPASSFNVNAQQKTQMPDIKAVQAAMPQIEAHPKFQQALQKAKANPNDMQLQNELDAMKMQIFQQMQAKNKFASQAGRAYSRMSQQPLGGV